MILATVLAHAVAVLVLAAFAAGARVAVRDLRHLPTSDPTD